MEYLKFELKLVQIFMVPIIIGINFFDKGNLVILVNGFQKKTQKTPKAEIKLAEKLKKEYLDIKYKK